MDTNFKRKALIVVKQTFRRPRKISKYTNKWYFKNNLNISHIKPRQLINQRTGRRYVRKYFKYSTWQKSFHTANWTKLHLIWPTQIRHYKMKQTEFSHTLKSIEVTLNRFNIFKLYYLIVFSLSVLILCKLY